MLVAKRVLIGILRVILPQSELEPAGAQPWRSRDLFGPLHPVEVEAVGRDVAEILALR